MTKRKPIKSERAWATLGYTSERIAHDHCLLENGDITYLCIFPSRAEALKRANAKDIRRVLIVEVIP